MTFGGGYMKSCCDLSVFYINWCKLEFAEVTCREWVLGLESHFNINIVMTLKYNRVKITCFSRNTYCVVWRFNIAIRRRIQENEPEAITKLTSLFSTVSINEP